MCGRMTPVPKSVDAAAKIRLGELSRDAFASSALTASSQRIRTATKPISP